MSVPTVSVIIPTYNRPDLLGCAIESVRAQTFQDFEIIVVDDGMEYGAEATVATYTDKRIRYIAHDSNKGCSVAKNTGIHNARGIYIAFLDDDDTWMPEKLERQVGVFESTPDDVGFSFHAAIEVFDFGEHITQVPEGVDDYYEQALRKFSGFIASSLMFRSEVFGDVDGLNESYPSHTDIELILRLIKADWRGVGINEPLVKRNGGSSHIQMGSNYQNRIKGREMLLAAYADDFDQRPRFLAKHTEQLAKFYRHEEQWGEARAAFLRAFALHHKPVLVLHYLSLIPAGIGYRAFRWGKRFLAHSISPSKKWLQI